MSLENFRKVRIQLHRADEPILHKLVAKEGDYNGRELEVQLTNRYVLENQSGVTLRLYWRHLKHGNQGIRNFEAVDRSNGLFKVTYPNQMLSPGNVSCHVQIQDGDKIINTQTFTILVNGSGFNAQTAIASDDYSALNEAFVEMDKVKKDFENEFNSIRQNFIRQVNELVDDYEPKLQGLQNQFDDVIANVTVDSEVIAARTSTNTGESFTTIGNRLNDIELGSVIENVDSGERFKASLKIKDGQPYLEMEEV